jgi:hypothetical protein
MTATLGVARLKGAAGNGFPKQTRGPIAPGDRKRSPFDRGRIDVHIIPSNESTVNKFLISISCRKLESTAKMSK